ncbi:olfactory receptor 10C1-like [Hemicordylus capensis]|uniref:olfactory receptor 10C1-like n=1 Tax=Hemicordylus capensis TaxID=884348 RepID=UPI0023045A02|nr:olfactory receptor 10C1-like [Hemicordylus capensis]
MFFVNNTPVTSFILLGFSDVPRLHPLLFTILFSVYLITLLSNGLIIAIINADHSLHTPMYFFLTHLSFLEIFYTSVTTPKMLDNLLVKQTTISFWGCAAQMFFFLFFGVAECFLLASMSFDRYVAICRPLTYGAVMNKKFCIQLVVGSWICGSAVALGHTTLMFHLPFCGIIINHFFCEIQPLFELVCGDTFLSEIQVIAVAVLAIMVPFWMIIFSYSCILHTIFMMPSSQNRYKAFSTCSSHLLVVTLFYGTAGFMYLRPRSCYLPSVDKLLSLFYAIVTPLLNPVIYSLRNKEFKGALRKLLKKYLFH